MPLKFTLTFLFLNIVFEIFSSNGKKLIEKSTNPGERARFLLIKKWFDTISSLCGIALIISIIFWIWG